MKMNLKLLFCPGFLLLLIVSQNQARARPISSLQSLSKLLDEDLEHPLVSEERDREQDDMIPTGAFDQQDAEFQWTRNTREQPESMSMGDSAVQRFFSDLLNSLRRYREARSERFSPAPQGCLCQSKETLSRTVELNLALEQTDFEVPKDLLPFSEIFSTYSHQLHQSIYYMMY